MAEKPSETYDFSIRKGGKFEGKFHSEIVRKAAYILGTICAVFSLAGAVLKLNSLPGGGILLVLFTTLFSVAAMPLYLFSLSKVETEKAMQFAIKLCGFSFAVLQVGLLFCVQRWPGEMNMIYVGAAGQVVFLIIFLANFRKPDVKTRSISNFSVLALLVVASLGVGCWSAKEKTSEIEDKSGIFTQELSDYVILKNRVDSMIVEFHSDSMNHDIDSAATEYFTDALEVVSNIEELKCGFLSRLNDNYYCDGTEKAYRVDNPNDVDVSTLMMVGENPAVPNGKGIILYGYLAVYRNIKLHPDIKFAIPIGDTPEYKDQWVKDNFYHITAMEMMIRMTVIQKNIYQSVEESIQKKLFVE